MRIRYFAVFAMLILVAVTASAREGEYRETDNGLLGTMERMAEGQVGFTRLANVLSAVMDDNNIAESELRKLRPGRRIVLSDSYLDDFFRVPRSVVRESARILNQDLGHREANTNLSTPRQVVSEVATARIAALTEQIKETEASFAGEREALKARIAELEANLETQKENARAAAANYRNLLREAERNAAAATARAEKLEKEMSESNKNLFRALARKTIDQPALGMAIWFLIGALTAIFGAWVYREIYYKDKYFVRPLSVFETAPDGTKVEFIWEEENAGYTCTLCRDKKGSPSSIDESREQGIGIKRENLKRHLSRSRNHSDIRVIGSTARDTA